jgi:ABC transporter substrate binding protein
MSMVEDDPEGQARVRAFVDGLQQLGWADGRNVRIDIRWTAGNPADTGKYAAELVALTPDVIFASVSVNVAALQRITRSVPIVFANVIDPVGAGLVTICPSVIFPRSGSLRRPTPVSSSATTTSMRSPTSISRGNRPDIRGGRVLSNERAVFRLAGANLHRDRLVVDVLDLVDALRFGQNVAGGVIRHEAVAAVGDDCTARIMQAHGEVVVDMHSHQNSPSSFPV